MIKNWYFWIVLACAILVIGGVADYFFGWPYLAYAGYILFGGVCLLWSVLALFSWLKK